jgi:hypothetical protein
MGLRKNPFSRGQTPKGSVFRGHCFIFPFNAGACLLAWGSCLWFSWIILS